MIRDIPVYYVKYISLNKIYRMIYEVLCIIILYHVIYETMN